MERMPHSHRRTDTQSSRSNFTSFDNNNPVAVVVFRRSFEMKPGWDGMGQVGNNYQEEQQQE